MSHPDFTYDWMGEGEELDPFEYEVKMYLTLGGAVHDAAIAAWSVKGYYDYVRPFLPFVIWPVRGNPRTPPCRATARMESRCTLALLNWWMTPTVWLDLGERTSAR